MIHYYIIFYSYLPKLNSQLFSYQIWAGRKNQFFSQGQISRKVLCYIYAYSITVLYLDIFFLMCTVDGRNPVPPGWYYFWSGAVSTIRSWTHTNEQENPGSVRTRSFFLFFGCAWNRVQEIEFGVKTPMSGARSRGRGDGWIITIKGASGSCARQARADARREGARDPTLTKCDFPTGILGDPNVIYRHMPVV